MSWWTWRDAQGMVIERIEGRLLDVSASGCRLESTSTLEVGSVGVIEIQGLEAPIAEAARVCHTVERPGAATRYVLQLEFLPLPLAKRAPARAAVGGQVLVGSGERSGPSPTTRPAPAVAVSRERQPDRPETVNSGHLPAVDTAAAGVGRAIEASTAGDSRTNEPRPPVPARTQRVQRHHKVSR